MHWEKKICIRITLRRVVATLLAASIVINLVIVGAVFGADAAEPAPTSTPSPLTAIVTSTPSLAASTAEGTSTSLSTEFPTAPWTDTPGIAPPDTATPTSTSLASPGWPLCIKKFYWPRYRVLYGDTLYSLAPLTRSTVTELISANCLTDSRIYAGQLLYVPRLPAPASSATPSSTDTPTITPTATDTPTPTDTPTDTPTPSPTPTYTPTTTNTPTETPSPTPTHTPTDTLSPPPADILTVFEVSVGMTCAPEKFVAFSVSVFDPDGIAWVVVRLYGVDNVFLDEIFLNPGEGTYAGFTSIPDPYTVYDVAYYQFHALDSLGRSAESRIYRQRADNCFPPFGLDHRRHPTT